VKNTKTLTIKVTTVGVAFGRAYAAIPGGTARLLAVAVAYDAACPASTDVAMGCTLPVARTLLSLVNRNVDLPLSQLTVTEKNTAGVNRAAPATKSPFVAGLLWVDVLGCDEIADAVTVTAVVEV
jgi:hypothetical protein